MTKIKTHLAYAFAACLIGIGAAVAPKYYTVSHTEPEWANIVQGVAQTREVIHRSNLPANEAFWCDSALTAIQNDVYRQVIAQKQAEDTTSKKKGGR